MGKMGPVKGGDFTPIPQFSQLNGYENSILVIGNTAKVDWGKKKDLEAKP